MEQEFKLGPIQEAWLSSLVNNADRQMTSRLGEGTPENYKACCLGEGLVCITKAEGNPLSIIFNEHNHIIDSDENSNTVGWTGTLQNSWGKLGLKSSTGIIEGSYRKYLPKLRDCITAIDLAGCNDCGMTWPQIAEFIRKYPQAVFNESK